MNEALYIGGSIFLACVALLVLAVLLMLGVGFVRALSLHKFLFRVRRAVDKGWCPFNRWQVWPREFLKDAYCMAGCPGEPHGISYHFSRPDGPVDAHWHGVGDWKVGTAN